MVYIFHLKLSQAECIRYSIKVENLFLHKSEESHVWTLMAVLAARRDCCVSLLIHNVDYFYSMLELLLHQRWMCMHEKFKVDDIHLIAVKTILYTIDRLAGTMLLLLAFLFLLQIKEKKYNRLKSSYSLLIILQWEAKESGKCARLSVGIVPFLIDKSHQK